MNTYKCWGCSVTLHIFVNIWFSITRINASGDYNLQSCGKNLYYDDGICKCPKMLWDFPSGTYRAYRFVQQQCSPVYSQGPCSDTDWVIIRFGQGVCEFNPCNFHNNVNYVPYKGFCVTLNVGNDYCPGIMKLSISDGATPQCVSSVQRSMPITLSLNPTSDLHRSCSGGEVIGFDQECHPVALF